MSTFIDVALLAIVIALICYLTVSVIDPERF